MKHTVQQYLLGGAILVGLAAPSLIAAKDFGTSLNLPGYGRVSYEQLFEDQSQEGETLDAFMLRVAPKLRAYSDKTKYEACAAIASDGQRFGVIVGTNRAHVACAVLHEQVPEGMKTIGESIHSHGGEGSFSSTRSDMALMGPALAQAKSLGKRKVVHGQVLDQFSEVDFQAGPGYLATPDGLLHQNKGKVRKVRSP